MPRLAVRADRLAKQYQIGRVRVRNGERPTLGDAIVDAFKAPLANLRAIRGLGALDRTVNPVTWALRDVSFDLYEGEVLGVIGRNGAGKSTLLKILSRITRPTRGRAEVYGRIGSLLEIGTGFHPDLTGRQNVYLNGSILGMERRQIARKFDDIVEFAGVGPFIDTPVKRYSSGMHVRLAFAVAAHFDPDVMIVDEVLAVGDAEFQRKCLSKMDDAARGGRTVLFVSHDMDAVQRLCTRCIMLDAGEVVATGSTQDIVSRYLAVGAARTPSAIPDRWIALNGVERSGTGDVRFEALRYATDNACIDRQLYPDGPVEFTLRIRSDLARRIASFAISFYDEHGRVLANADTLSIGRTLHVERGETLVSMRIDALHLRPGIYTVGLWLAEAAHVVYDYVPAAVRVEIVDVARHEAGPRTVGAVTCDFSVHELQTGMASRCAH